MLDRRAPPARQPRTVSLRLQVVAIDATHTAPNLMDRRLSVSERLGSLQPVSFEMRLRGKLRMEDHEALGALAKACREGGGVTVTVEVEG